MNRNAISSSNENLTTFKVIDTSTGLKADTFVLDSVKIAGNPVTVDKSKATAVSNEDGTVTYTVDLSDFISTTEAGATIEVKYSAIVENDHTYNNPDADPVGTDDSDRCTDAV